MKHTWKYGGAELECDVFEPDCYEKIDLALKRLSADLSAIEYSALNGDKNSVHDTSAKLRRNCEVIETFFDGIFGTDGRKAALGEERNIMSLAGALASFLCYIDGEIKAMTESGEKIKASLAERLAVL
jgi:hypothetical protein